jgi:hypothetical protein
MAGQYSFGLRLDDSQGVAASENFILEFIDTLKIESTFIGDILVGDEVNTTFLASGGKQPYVWGIAEGTLPEGISLAEDGVLSGSSNISLISEFTVRLSDSVGEFIDRNMSVNILEPIRIESISLPFGTSGEGYSFELKASGGKKPYKWSFSNGFLPEGVELSQDGVLSGVPVAATKASATIRVTDSSGRSAAFTYDLSVSVGQEIQTIAARGGTVTIEINDNILKYIENNPNDGFAGFLVSSTAEKVQVHFIGEDGQIPSWVLCEVSSIEICTFN